MKKTGVVRKIDELGRLTVPKDMRKKLRIKDDEFIELVLVLKFIVSVPLEFFDDKNVTLSHTTSVTYLLDPS